MREILRAGTSAGGARAKAVIAWNPHTNVDKQGQWSLAPAFDVTYSYNPSGAWTAAHQVTLNGKRDGFTLEDLQGGAPNRPRHRPPKPEPIPGGHR